MVDDNVGKSLRNLIYVEYDNWVASFNSKDKLSKSAVRQLLITWCAKAARTWNLELCKKIGMSAPFLLDFDSHFLGIPAATRVGMRMQLEGNAGIKPVRFGDDYNSSIFDATHADFNNFTKMDFSAPRNVVDPVEVDAPPAPIVTRNRVSNDDSSSDGSSSDDSSSDNPSDSDLSGESSSEYSSATSESEEDSEQSLEINEPLPPGKYCCFPFRYFDVFFIFLIPWLFC
jgi:hypothetical protein